MNDRIKEMMPKPWTFPFPDRELYTKEQMEQMAELVIGEIMDYCLSMEIGNQYTPEEMLFQAKYRKIVREHFGLT